jgi:hypothetical protein
MRTAFLALILTTAAGAASAQVYAPGQPYVGDPMADRLRDRMESQRIQSEQRALYSRQHQSNARQTEAEIRAQRQPAPYVPLVDVPASADSRRRAREAATTRHEATAAGVGQIDSWLDRQPN